MYKMIKTTLDDWNRGYTDSPWNCYYKGTSVCWGIINSNNKEEVIALNRKKDAVKMVDFLNNSKWDGNGDPMMIFCRYLKSINDFDTIDKIKEV